MRNDHADELPTLCRLAWPAAEDRAKTGFAEIKDAYPIGWYAWLWDQINGRGAWDANPWVVAYTFTVHRCNVDQMAKEAG